MSGKRTVFIFLIVSATACASAPLAPAPAPPTAVLCADEAACRSACAAGDAAACARAGVLTTRPEETPEDRTLRLCEAGTAASCYEAGVFTAEGRGVPADAGRALALFERACTASHGDGCEAAGVMLRDGKGRAADPAAAARLFERGCSAGSAEACGALAAQLELGQGVPQDSGRALTLNRDACAKRAPGACFALGQALENGRGAAVDLSGASSAYRAGCGLGHATACWRAGQLAEQGKGLPANAAEIFEWYVAGWTGGDRDSTLAASRLRLSGAVAFAKDPAEWDAKLYEAACALDDQAACVERGWQLRLGDSAAEFRAQKLGETGCTRGIAAGCNLAGLIAFGVAGDLAQAESFYRRGCAAGNKEACANQGLVLAQCTRGGPCDATRGKALLQTACAERIDFACRELANLLRKGKSADRAAAAALLDRSCELGAAESCYEAGVDAKTRPAARTYFERGCTLGDQAACFQFVAMLEAGDGGATNPAQAQTIMEQQCQPVPRIQWGDSCSGWCAKHADVAFCR